MHQIYGAIEFRVASEWYEVISASALLFQHADLNACLFGFDNYAECQPLFPDRGLPDDCSESVRTNALQYLDEDSHPSWVLWDELMRIDWHELALQRDQRVSEFRQENGEEVFVTKWLNKAGFESVKEALDHDPVATVECHGRVFRRSILTRNDSLSGTDFPLLMKLMACLAERFGDDGVRLTVWFG
jgi:hypothetical protein